MKNVDISPIFQNASKRLTKRCSVTGALEEISNFNVRVEKNLKFHCTGSENACTLDLYMLLMKMKHNNFAFIPWFNRMEIIP